MRNPQLKSRLGRQTRRERHHNYGRRKFRKPAWFNREKTVDAQPSAKLNRERRERVSAIGPE